MHRHDLDPVALVFGATFAALGFAYAIARWSWIGIAHGWVLGVFLIVLGVAGAVSATTRQRGRADESHRGARMAGSTCRTANSGETPWLETQMRQRTRHGDQDRD